MGIFFGPSIMPRAREAEPALKEAIVKALRAQPATGEQLNNQADELTNKVAPIAGPARNTIRTAVRDALATQPPEPAQLDAAAVAKTNAITQQLTSKPFQTGRFIGAIIIFAVIIAVGITTDALGWADSSKALFGFGTTIFGVVVGLLGGEKPSDE